MLVGKDLGPFHVESELGSGAMGFVYRAVRRDTGQRVAIKVIAYGLLANETAVKRFEREADILKQLRHPNIVRFIGTGSYKRTPFFIMEYVEGESLDKWLVRRGPFPWDEVVVLGRQLCAALQHAHDKGIIHRDLKPSNLMILKDGTLKLTDFGIAKDADLTALTAQNCTVGTAAYMSPEQCRGEKILSAKSDLYSMGVVFYELLTGQKPFQKESPIEMFQAHVSDPFERPRRLVMDIPVWLDNIVCQLLEKKPEHRPYDAQMVAKALEEVEQKVSDLRSAGVEAATGRGRDATRAADETDRDAARTLRGAVAKRKLRKKAVPLTDRKWFRATLLGAGLAGVVLALMWFTRPAGEDLLYRRAKMAVESKDSDRAMEATERYLSRFAGREDAAHLSEVKAWNRSLWVQKREQQLHNRFGSKLNLAPEDDGQKIAFQAFKRENAGELDDAAQLWRELADKYRAEQEPEPAVYAWVAQKKLADLAGLEARKKQLQASLDELHGLRPPEHPPQFDGAARGSFEAYRLEEFGDRIAARDEWQKVVDEYQRDKDLSQRGWVLLAADHLRRLRATITTAKEKEKAERLAFLKQRFDQFAGVTDAADPIDLRKAVPVYRDLRDLYANDPDPAVAALAQRAKQRLQELKRS